MSKHERGGVVFLATWRTMHTHPSAPLWHDALLPTYTCATLSITLPTQAFLSSAADVNRANEHAFTLLEALDVPTVYNVS